MKPVQQVTDLQAVQSSNIDAIAYENGSLFVQYKSGLYRYDKVPVDVYEEMKKSESKGKFMNSAIKGTYGYEKVELELKLKEVTKAPEVPSVEEIRSQILADLNKE